MSMVGCFQNGTEKKSFVVHVLNQNDFYKFLFHLKNILKVAISNSASEKTLHEANNETSVCKRASWNGL